MNKLIVLALVGAAFGATPAFAQSSSDAYRALTDKASSDYKAARAQCDSSSGNAKKVCQESAKVARARADADAVAQYRNTPADLSKARISVANAEYDLAKTKCGDMSGSAKSSCMNDAKQTQSMALADAKAGAQGSARTMARTDCDALTGAEKAGCMARSGGSTAKVAMDDTMITTKVKADLVREPDLKAMNVHVETVQGVVTLSGFVPSQDQADRAARIARGIDGVSEVKSSLQVQPSK